MITFVSLFLGLVVGPQPVEVAVASAAQVAAIELRLDGEHVATLETPPFRTQVDFGALAPHLLEAVALDSAGDVVERVLQRINVPRDPAEVEILVSRGEDGSPRDVRLLWQSTTITGPRSIQLTLDGTPIPVDDEGRGALPAFDPTLPNLLEAEVRFAGDVTARAYRVLSDNRLGDQVTTQLTAVPVLMRGRRLPQLPALQGWIQHRGNNVPVVATEKGEGLLVVVRDPRTAGDFARLLRGSQTGATQVRPSGSGYAGGGSSTAVRDRGDRYFEELFALPDDVRLRMLDPSSRRVDRQEVRMEQFPLSPAVDHLDGGLFGALRRRVITGGLAPTVRLNDAIAVAGFAAAAADRRRLVLVIQGPGEEDGDLFSTEEVRAYLRAMRVPVLIWRVGGDQSDASERDLGVYDLHDRGDLRVALRVLRSTLERQRVLWIEGDYMPQNLALELPARVAQPAGWAP